MRRVLLSLAVVLVVSAPVVGHALDGIDWNDTEPESGVVMEDDVLIEGQGTHRLIVIADPGIVGDAYSVAGSVRYQDVAGTGYFEMWSFFPDGGAYFSRTLGRVGPTAALIGTSESRPFELPFSLNGAPGPERVEVNLVLPEGGTVWVGSLSLAGFGASDAWWNERQAGTIGATLGVIAGLLGATIGILNGTQRNPRLVEGLLMGGVFAGILLLLAGGFAMVASQPWHVSYPLLLAGTILTLVSGALLPAVRRNSASTELRRMRALDV